LSSFPFIGSFPDPGVKPGMLKRRRGLASRWRRSTLLVSSSMECCFTSFLRGYHHYAAFSVKVKCQGGYGYVLTPRGWQFHYQIRSFGGRVEHLVLPARSLDRGYRTGTFRFWVFCTHKNDGMARDGMGLLVSEAPWMSGVGNFYGVWVGTWSRSMRCFLDWDLVTLARN